MSSPSSPEPERRGLFRRKSMREAMKPIIRGSKDEAVVSSTSPDLNSSAPINVSTPLEKEDSSNRNLATSGDTPESLKPEEKREEVVKKEIKPHIRERILKEILDTEVDYVNDLAVLISVYKEPLDKLGIISGVQTETLFSNLNSIYEINKDHVLAPMKAKFDECKASGGETWKLSLGDIFLSLQVHLAAYTDYCSNQPLALAMLKSLETNKQEFAEFLNNIMNDNPTVRGLSLLSFLIKPVQRLCKYPLLLRELIGNTNPEDSEYSQLITAADVVKQTVTFVNEKQREAEEKLAERMKKIEDLSEQYVGLSELNLSADVNRDLTRSGKVDIVMKKTKHDPRQLLLFNDMLLVCKIKKGKGSSLYKVESTTQISDIIVTNLADEESALVTIFGQSIFALPNLDVDGKNGFMIKDKKNDTSFTFTADTNEEKAAWVDEFKRLIKDHQKQLAKQLKRTQVTTTISMTTSQLQAAQKSNEEEIKMLEAKLALAERLSEFLNKLRYEPVETREASWRAFLEEELAVLQDKEKDITKREKEIQKLISVSG